MTAKKSAFSDPIKLKGEMLQYTEGMSDKDKAKGIKDAVKTGVSGNPAVFAGKQLLTLGKIWVGAHRDAQVSHFREAYVGAFASGLVAAANGASSEYILTLNSSAPAGSVVYPEINKVIRELHFTGLRDGIAIGKKFNTTDQQTFFTWIHAQFDDADKAYYSPSIPWRDWSSRKRKDYYIAAAAFVKRNMFKNNLELKLD